MKKHIYTLLLFVSCTTIALAQVPDSINYQAIIRYTSGKLIVKGKTVNFRFTVTVGTANATTETYIETKLHTINNDFGLANLKIGNGLYVSGVAKLSKLPWQNANAELTVEVDTLGGTVFNNISTTSLVTVPYAFYANKADSAANARIANEITNLSFNGTTLTVGTKTQTLPKDTIQALAGNIITVAPSAYGLGTKYTLSSAIPFIKYDALTNQIGVSLGSGYPYVPQTLPTYNYYAGTGLKLTNSLFSFDTSIVEARPSLLNTTQVKFNNSAKKVHVFTPLPHLEFNTTNKYLTIRDTLAGLIKDSVNLSALVKTYIAGNGIKISNDSIINTKPDIPLIITNNSGPSTPGGTTVTGTYPNFTVTTNPTTNKMIVVGNNYLLLSVDNVIQIDTLVRSVKDSITPTGKLVTQVNGVNSTSINLPRGLDTITFNAPPLYSSITVYGGNKTIAPVLKTQVENTFFAGPFNTSGSAAPAAPIFRIIDNDDLPVDVVNYKTGSTLSNYIPKFNLVAGSDIQNSKLYESVAATFIGYIGLNTNNPRNNFTINGVAKSSLQLTSAGTGFLANDGFVIKFDSVSASTTMSNKPNGLMNFQTNGFIDRMSIADTSVFIKTKLNLNSAINVGGLSKYGASGDVLTSQGASQPPKWAPASGASIWTRSGTTISQVTTTDNVNLGFAINTNPNAKLAVYTRTGFDTAIYAQSAGKIGIVGDVQNNSTQTYGVRGISNGKGLNTLQTNSATTTNYSAGVFGETFIPSGGNATNITYGVMGKSSSTHPQAAGVFGIANTDSSDAVRGITTLGSNGNAGSFVNFASNNGSPTVFISNQATTVTAAALNVDGGQVVKTKVITNASYTQTLGDYMILLNGGATQTVNLLNPNAVPAGTIVIIRKYGNFGFIATTALSAGIIDTFDLPFSSASTSTTVTIPTDFSLRLVASGNVWLQW